MTTNIIIVVKYPLFKLTKNTIYPFRSISTRFFPPTSIRRPLWFGYCFNQERKWSTYIRVRMMSTMSAAPPFTIPSDVGAEMNAVLLSQFGSVDNLLWGRTHVPSVLRDGHIMIQVSATAVNRADIVQRMGNYPPPKDESEILGLEAAGYVVKCGACCTKFKVGDRVMALLPGGGYAEYCTVDERHAMRVPDSVDFVRAAAIPEVWLTAYQLINIVPRGFIENVRAANEKNDVSAVVHAGASSVGIALIQLLKLLNIKVYVTVGTQEKVDFCMGLGADGGFNYRSTSSDWSSEVGKLEPEGVDIIFDPVGAQYFGKNMKCLKMDGHLVLFGLMSGSVLEKESIHWILKKRINVHGSTLRNRSSDYKASLVLLFEQEVLPKFTQQPLLKTPIFTQMPLTHVKEAHSLMESNVSTGKIVLTISNG